MVVGSNPAKLKRTKMKFNTKELKASKTQKYLKTYNFFLIYNGIHQNNRNWLLINQELYLLKLNYLKLQNKMFYKTINKTIFKNLVSSVSTVTYFIASKNKNFIKPKDTLIKKFEFFSFKIVALKFNHKIYSALEIKTVNSFNYKLNKLSFYQSGIITLKKHIFEIM